MLGNTSNAVFRRSWPAGIAVAVLAIGLSVVGMPPGLSPALAETCEQGVINPDFEDGMAGWEAQSATGSQLVASDAAFHGSYGARLGGTNVADDRLWQWIAFPGSLSSVSLAFFYRVDTTDSSDPPADSFSVQLLDEQGQLLIELVRLNNRNTPGQWFRRMRFFDPTESQSLAGRRVRLEFRATTDRVAPTAFLIDDIGLEVCTGGPPAISDLRMGRSAHAPARDHFPTGLEEVLVSFAYENVGKDDQIRLWIRDVNGTSLLDHTYTGLVGSGTRDVAFTGRDAVDGLTRSALQAGNSVAQHAERALQADNRFRMAPYAEQAVLAVTMLQDATETLGAFNMGSASDDYLAQARAHVEMALEAGQSALAPATDLAHAKTFIAEMRDEVQVAVVKVAEARSALSTEPLRFPDTVDCQFYLTNIYLNGFPADSIEWTVGTAGSPARLHPPYDRRRSGVLHIQPAIIYTQGVSPADAPHVTTISGRAIDADCRPVVDGTQVDFSLDDPTLGTLSPPMTSTSDGYFTTSLWTTDNLGDGAVSVRARVGAVEGSGVVFLVGPPASVVLNTSAFTLNPGDSMPVVVQVRDARGQAVADGTEVSFSLSPTDGGTITPANTATANGFTSATFAAGDEPGYVAIRARAGEVSGVTVVEIAGAVSTATPAPTATPTPSPVPTRTPTPSPTPTPPCDSRDPEQLCNGVVSVRVFEDARCDGQFNNGTDRALFGVSVSLIYPDGTSLPATSDPSGYAHFGGVHLRGDERVALLAEYPEEMVTSGLTPCDNSGTLKFLARQDFGSFGTASVRFRAYRQIVVRQGILQMAEASLCFTAKYYLDPTDGGPIVYLMTDDDLSDYLSSEVRVTGSTWEIEFCRYLMPFSIELVP